MVTMKDILEEATRDVDDWIEVCQKHGEDPITVMKTIQEVIFTGSRALTETDAPNIMLPTRVFAGLAALASIGRHMVVTRLVEKGLTDPDKLVIKDPKGMEEGP